MDGKESSEKIMDYCKNMEIVPKIYACTANDNSKSALEEYKNHGMVDMLPKPMAFPVLMNLLK